MRTFNTTNRFVCGQWVIWSALAAVPLAQAASLSVNSFALPPNNFASVVVAGNIVGESTYGVTIQLELVPRVGATGTVVFTTAPPSDITALGDAWLGTGTFSVYDVDLTGSALLNGAIDDNGTFLSAAVSFSGELAAFPIFAGVAANGVWDVLLSTSAGNSGWEALTTTLNAGTITISAGACLTNADCNDADVCTTDVCVAGSCINTNNTAACNDGLLCTIGDVCGGGICAGSPVDCSGLDGSCTVGVCNGGTGLCQAAAANEGVICSDGALCTTSDVCVSGVCVGSPVDCSLLNSVCTLGSCHSGTGLCQSLPANKGGLCNDGNLCTAGDICGAGVCAGTLVDCSGLNDACNIGFCVSATGACQASAANEGGPCSDGALCTINDECTAGACVGTLLDCSALNSTCTLGACNVATGICFAAPVNGGGVCNDNNACTSGEICVNGVCLGTPIAGCDPCTIAADCNDGNPCTNDSCHPAGVCIHVDNTLACNDGVFCTANDVCSAGACVGTGDRCPGQMCDEAGDVCVDCLTAGNCDDANVCTTDSCSGGVCLNVTNVLACNDGLFCTLTDVCLAGSCVGGATPCVGQLCDEVNDLCVTCLGPADCNDSNVCTTDACVAGACVTSNNLLPCNDGLFCTASDACSIGVCVGTGDPCPVQLCSEKLDACVSCLTNADCNDLNLCTNDSCAAGACVLTPNSALCNDGLFCTLTDICSGAACTGSGTPCLGQLCNEVSNLCVDCLVDLDCDDDNPCTDDVCTVGLCSNVNSTAPCSDGLFCTALDNCSAGICVGSGAPCPGQLCNELTNACVDCLVDGDCNDGNPCTDDSCASGLCVLLNNSLVCNDGLFCTLADVCSGGVCVGAGNRCPGQLCNESTDACVACIVSADCDDSNFCTDDACVGGACTNVNNVNPCNDGLFCTQIDACSVGVCVGSGNPCPVSFCNELVDQCVTCLVAADCNDANPCTNDACNAGVCVFSFNTSPCNDGMACTTSDFCTLGACVGAPVDCSSLDADCLLGLCNSANGLCEAISVNEAGPCDDGDLCTQGGACISGACLSQPVDCSGINSACRVGSCNGATGLCVGTPINNGLACNDADICTSTDACNSGFCIGTLLPNCASCATAANCDDVNPCTSDFCHPVGVCYHGNLAGSCDDGDPCTSGDACASGVCIGASIAGCISCTVAADCNDGTPCTADSCIGGVCQFAPVNGGACDDGNICTSTDACSGGVCAGAPIAGCDICVVNLDCNDGNPCTTDTCHPIGVCIYANNTSPCNDGIACTRNDICNGGTCTGSLTPDGGACDDGSLCTVGETCVAGECIGAPANEGAACTDGNLCTVVDVCLVGVCTGVPVNCSSLTDSCNTGVCSAATGTCQQAPLANGVACSDVNLCTSGDACLAGVCTGSALDCSGLTTFCSLGVCNTVNGQCVASAINEGLACDDVNLCTTGEVCTLGVCSAASLDCSSLSGACVVGVCNMATGACETAPANEGGPCNDANTCTQTDVCTGGVCGGTPLDCSLFNTTCSVSICNPTLGACEDLPINEGGVCDDANFCTLVDVCSAGACAGAPVDCSSLTVGCQVGVCNAGTGVCETVAAGPGASCSDGNLCTTGDICTAGVCAGTPINCSSLNTVCAIGVCQGTTGLCQASATNENGVCNDNLRCTVNDRCQSGVCIGAPKNCTALNDVCNVGVCIPASGACIRSPANNGGVCNDGYACTLNDVCTGGVCEGASIDPELVDVAILPNSLTVMVGSTFSVNLTAMSQSCFPLNVGSVQSILSWDPLRLQFLGRTDIGPTSWAYSGFPNDGAIDGLNSPYGKTPGNDGDALYLALASFVDGAPAGPLGLVVTTLQFKALAITNATPITIPGFAGTLTASEVLGQGSNQDITGVLRGSTIRIIDCVVVSDCDDGNVCTTDSCNSGFCSHIANTATCNDGLFCNTTDVCSGGVCVGSGDRCPGQFCNEAIDACVQCLISTHCNDGNVCTTDSCIAGACSFTNNTVACNDGLFCTLVDTCASGACVGAGATCLGSFCDEATNACVQCLNSGHCNDGNVCTSDTCASGVCVRTNNSAVCNDGLYCTLTDACSGGVCAGSGVRCPGAFCSEPLDACVQCLTNTHCVDGNPCTDDVCSALGACGNPNNAAPCEDGNFCTAADACFGGLCQPGLADACPNQVCDEAGNRCLDCFVSADCNDGFACTTEVCSSEVCIFTTNHAVCSDGFFCTGVETCVVGSGCTSPGAPCDSPALCEEIGDFCRCPAPSLSAAGSRLIRATPAAGTVPVALAVDASAPGLSCLPKYVDALGDLVDLPVFRLPSAWGSVTISSAYIEPSTLYVVQSDCRATPIAPINLSPTAATNTYGFGDIDGSGQVDVDDLINVLFAFSGVPIAAADIMGCEIDGVIDVDDLVAVLSAFAGELYTCPDPCP